MPVHSTRENDSARKSAKILSELCICIKMMVNVQTGIYTIRSNYDPTHLSYTCLVLDGPACRGDSVSSLGWPRKTSGPVLSVVSNQITPHQFHGQTAQASAHFLGQGGFSGDWSQSRSTKVGLIKVRPCSVKEVGYPQRVCICPCVSAFSDLVDMNLTLFISLLSNQSRLTKFKNPSLIFKICFFFSPLACNFVTFHCWLSE